jgi:fimbrial chaperone protein
VLGNLAVRFNSVAGTIPIACACFGLLAFGQVEAGEFTVNPIRLELGAQARSGVIVVENEGQSKLGFQLSAMEWTQDASGTERYADTRDLIFFPKIMTVDPGQKSLIRVGTTKPVVASERTYRLFIEELPSALPESAKKTEGTGAQINVLVRFGAPIFVVPVKAQDGIELEGLAMATGAVSFTARNTGNRHQIVQSIQLKGADASGREVYALTLADRYLLAGTAKPYTTRIDVDRCSKISTLEVEIKTDKASTKRKLDVTRAMCH